MGENVTNLKRHIISTHFDAYQQEMEQDQNTSKQNCGERRKQKITVEVSEKEIKDACLEFTTVQSQPLYFFD